jgi:hypothetical protein
VGSLADDLHKLRDELRLLMQSYEYAFAMGHGCSLGDHPQFGATRRKVLDLRARIAELSG